MATLMVRLLPLLVLKFVLGDILTVHFWEDVDIYGAEKFKETVSLEPTSYSSVPDLDVADQSRLHSTCVRSFEYIVGV